MVIITGKRYRKVFTESNNLSKQEQVLYWESVTVRNITNETNKTNGHELILCQNQDLLLKLGKLRSSCLLK